MRLLRLTPVRRLVLGASLLGPVLALVGACIVRKVDVVPIHPDATPQTVSTPVKAHLLDGSTVVYDQGVLVGVDSLRGDGTRYDLTLTRSSRVFSIPLDSVAGMENYRTGVRAGPTLLASTLGIAAGAFATAALAVAIFGSCPTVYSDSAGTVALEAESFSYSIAPLFERRDVDRLRAQPGADGVLRLEVRNEALETHFINHLELLEVRHAADETVLPDAQYRMVAVRGLAGAAVAVDRTGRDLRAVIAGDDTAVFRTDRGTLAAATARDLDDYIDLTFAAPRGADSAAVVLNLRNSLLNTVLLYDEMLGAQGARALDWLGRDMATIGRAVELGRWYGSRMGMRVLVWQSGRFEPVAYVPDAGPIAWRRVAAVVPVPPGDSIRVRLSFTADQWRIGSVALAARVRVTEPRRIPIAAVVGADGAADSAALASLHDPDARYLETRPGQRFEARFVTGTVRGDSLRTFALAAQGYYTEWIRPSWIRAAQRPRPFVPSDSALVAALRRWDSSQDDLERRFAATRIPVR